MDESVEENAGVPVFLPFFDEKAVFVVEENAGVPVFLPFFDEKAVFGVEENREVPVFLPFFDENVIFVVEENRGGACFPLQVAPNSCRQVKKPTNIRCVWLGRQSKAVSASGRRLDQSRGAPPGALF